MIDRQMLREGRLYVIGALRHQHVTRTRRVTTSRAADRRRQHVRPLLSGVIWSLSPQISSAGAATAAAAPARRGRRRRRRDPRAARPGRARSKIRSPGADHPHAGRTAAAEPGGESMAPQIHHVDRGVVVGGGCRQQIRMHGHRGGGADAAQCFAPAADRRPRSRARSSAPIECPISAAPVALPAAAITAASHCAIAPMPSERRTRPKRPCPGKSRRQHVPAVKCEPAALQRPDACGRVRRRARTPPAVVPAHVSRPARGDVYLVSVDDEPARPGSLAFRRRAQCLAQDRR